VHRAQLGWSTPRHRVFAEKLRRAKDRFDRPQSVKIDVQRKCEQPPRIQKNLEACAVINQTLYYEASCVARPVSTPLPTQDPTRSTPFLHSRLPRTSIHRVWRLRMPQARIATLEQSLLPEDNPTRHDESLSVDMTDCRDPVESLRRPENRSPTLTFDGATQCLPAGWISARDPRAIRRGRTGGDVQFWSPSLPNAKATRPISCKSRYDALDA